MAEKQEIKTRIFTVEIPEDWDYETYHGFASAVYQIPLEERHGATELTLYEAGEAVDGVRRIQIKATFDESQWSK